MEYRYMENDLQEAKATISKLIEDGESFQVHWVDLGLTLNPEARYLEIIIEED
ncbi:MAG TPA: hypothetical protein PLJ66_04575 [Methanofastidiosum sp.]|nr:hypothetical protein [Methanofastidiosum sp.]